MALTDLGPKDMQALYDRVAPKIRAEFPHDNDSISNEEIGILIPMNEWLKYALDGDVELFAAPGATDPDGALFHKRKAFTDARATLQTIRTKVTSHWAGEASDQFDKYLSLVETHLDHFIGDGTSASNPVGYLPQASAVLDMIFAVEVAFKNDLRELVLSAEKAVERMDDVAVDYRPALIFCGKLALIVAKQIPKADLVIEVAQLMWETADMPSLEAGTPNGPGERVEITGRLIIDVMRSFYQALTQVVEGYQASLAALHKHLDDVLEFVDDAKLSELSLSDVVPKWPDHEGKSLKDLLSLGETLEVPEINDRAAEEKAPPMPREKEEPAGPPGGPGPR
ncbi:hypothetical protein [Amycolatopsis suaedae]|uniref:Uncharacterized protein n=1 Tax=Amycolatopsis suaedae TaxID=2510978 RepID=A0A4Q7JEY0_9PSEU|nr:hypothetical protein [Amycolatopsis suaedae]RZQ65736.1 hypothetical protein EWH70_01205 [Amycolatopsis suaedae]